MSNVIDLKKYMRRDCTPAVCVETFSEDLRLMARHIRAHAGNTPYPLRLGALAHEIEQASNNLRDHDAP